MKHFRYLIYILTILFIFVSCSNEKSSISDETTDSAGDFLDTLESTPPQTEQNDSEQDFPIIGLFSHSANILDRNGNGFSLSTVEYTGKRIQFDLTSTIISDDKNETDEYDVTLFILIDGYIQPYYFNGADTPVDYTLLRVKSSEQAEKYTLSFDPLYVPYKKMRVSV